jgi:hypothetical protein
MDMKLKSLLEDIIAKDRINLKIDYGVNRTKHGEERQDRHVSDGGERISEKEIADAIKKAIPDITTAMILDKIDLQKDKVLVQSKENLNIVGIITQGPAGPNSLNFKIVTVMRNDNWRPNSDTKLIIKV